LPQENQLVQVLEKNTELAIQNTDLQKQVQKLQHHEPGKSVNPTALTSSTTMHESDRLDSILRVSNFFIKKNSRVKTLLPGNGKNCDEMCMENQCQANFSGLDESLKAFC
jgi:endonuclease III-like uncharacterized protein